MNLIVFLKDKNSGFLGGSHEHMGCELELGLFYGLAVIAQNILSKTLSLGRHHTMNNHGE